jgi:hypothetical protein
MIGQLRKSSQALLNSAIGWSQPKPGAVLPAIARSERRRPDDLNVANAGHTPGRGKLPGGPWEVAPAAGALSGSPVLSTRD